MRISLTNTPVIRPWLLIAATVVVLLLSGCGQVSARESLQIGRGQWVRAEDADIATAKEAEPPVIKAETYLATGKLVESQGNFAQAAKLYGQACEARPDYAAAWNRLGIVYDKLGKYDKAEEALRQAIKHAPKVAFLHNNLGFNYLLEGRSIEAEKSLRRAIELNPQFQRARVNLGIALVKQGRSDEALAQFKQAVPEAQAYYNMAYLHRQAGRWGMAGEYYERAWALDPKLSGVKESLALVEQGDAEDKESCGALGLCQNGDSAV